MEAVEKKENRRTKKKGNHSRSILFFDENFLGGIASVFDLFGRGNRLLFYDDPWQADWEALHGDWQMVGQDMWSAMQTFEVDHKADLIKQERLFDPDDDFAKPE